MDTKQDELFGVLYQFSAVVSALTDTTATTAQAAPGTRKRLVLTDVLVTHSEDSSAGVLVKILDGTTVIAQGWAAPGGGFTKAWKKPIPLTSNTALKVQLGGTIDGTGVYCCLYGFTEALPANT